MRRKRRKKPPQAPPTKSPVVGIRSGTREDLRSVAVYQKVIMGCIVVYFLVWMTLVAGQLLLPPMLLFMLTWVALGHVLVGVLFVFLLATKVYGAGAGILLGILALIPLLGLIVLLIVNRKATAILRLNGHHVGLLGANLSDF